MPIAASRLEAGTSAPLGASVHPGGVNFSVFAKNATGIELLLFDDRNDATPARAIALDARRHRTYHYWHVFVPELEAGQIYAYRAHGPFAPERGLRFDGEKVLVDPYGLAVAVPDGYDRAAARRPGGNAATAMKSVVADPDSYDWEGDAPLNRRMTETVIYELHVRGFTRDPSSGVDASRRGTYAGLIEKIPYLRDLGITAVELLPVFQFDPQDAPLGLNYWGYQPVSFFAPHHAFSSRREPLCVLDEFRDMVKALHRAGIEVILDVVFNHTTEGAEDGPTVCFRGLANDGYYTLEAGKSRYADYSGCGNTMNANQPLVRRLIQDSLRYWVTRMHVDGFRFDLASILSRDETGHPLKNPPILWDIESDPLLAGTKLIAEAWDAAGLYQVGSFVGDAWQEWNGRFRDDVRSFLKGDTGSVSRVAKRLLGSPDIYGHKEREVEHSINFVTCHDGFTLNDVVSYNQKHNEDNGSHNRDGADDNVSWNCGAEGPTDDAAIEALRNRQVKNFLTLEMLAAGTPMLLMGDEVRRTQRGNNNAYCQDSDISWFDWSLLERHADVHRFVKRLNAFRQRRDIVGEGGMLTLSQLWSRARIEWHGVKLHQPDWSDHSHSLAFTVQSLNARYLLHGMLNAYWEPLTFELPPGPDGHAEPWRRAVDTALISPDDISPLETAPCVPPGTYVVAPRSTVVLVLTLNRDPGAAPDAIGATIQQVILLKGLPLNRSPTRSGKEEAMSEQAPADDDLGRLPTAQELAALQRTTVLYYLHETHPDNGLVRDKTDPSAPCSIAAVGLALATIPAVVERGVIIRKFAAKIARRRLRHLLEFPQGPGANTAGHKGFFYHFLDIDTGRRVWDCELSTLDSAFLFAGALTCGTYFDADTEDETEVRRLADALYNRAEWTWALDGGATLAHGWKPESGFLPHRYEGYDEGLLLYVLGLGSPTHPLPPESYAAYCATYQWKEIYGRELLYSGPLFTHQLSHLWIDFRGIRDAFMRERGSDYFENSRQATLIQQEYAIRNPLQFEGYGRYCWGFTACDGPGWISRTVNGIERQFHGYIARGAPFGPDDGTVAPWVVVASLPFAPEIVIPTVRQFARLDLGMTAPYGFKPSFNQTFAVDDAECKWWVTPYHFGIDQGPVVLMIENYRSGLVWNIMRRCPPVIAGLRRAGFSDGWL